MTTSSNGDKSRIVEHTEGVVGSSNPRGLKLVDTDDYVNFSKYADPPLAPPRRGQRVRLGLDADGYIRTLEVLDAAPSSTSTSSSSNRDREIRRQVAMKTAAQLVGAFAQTHPEVKTEHVFPLADRIVEWLERED